MPTEKAADQSPDFGVAFQQMANFVAISRTRSAAETLDGLILQCYVVLPDQPLSKPEDLSEAIKCLFGLSLAEKDIESSINRLKSKGSIVGAAGGHLALSEQVRSELENHIERARILEEEVRSEWAASSGETPSLDTDLLWKALKVYLGRAFRRHGMLAAGLLHPDAAISPSEVDSLGKILDQVLGETIEKNLREGARLQINDFVRTVRGNRKRAEYITQLADGAFNYFSLAVSPEVSDKLRPRIKDTVVFLDTNFLLGFLGLQDNSQVDVSKELVQAVNDCKLPFRLRYHDATSRELSSVLHYFGSELAKRKWPQQISRAAARSGRLSSIELRYHQKNADRPLDVDDFMAPYRQWEIILKAAGVDVYRCDSSEPRLRRRADLEADYRDFLEGFHVQKPDEAIQHDMAVLETTHSLRGDALSLMESGVILVTCDHCLAIFDKKTSRRSGKAVTAVFPSVLWQILRPLMVRNEEFDEAFAETFALPEFVFARGGAQRAAAKMLSILSGYSEIPEETAFKMLTNDALLADLETKNDEAFAEAVESALGRENAVLLEEKAALARQVQAEKQEREKVEKDLVEKQKVVQDAQHALMEAERLKQEESARALQAVGRVKKEQATNEEVLRKLEESDKLRDEAQRVSLRTAKIASVGLGSTGGLLLLLTLNFVWPWPWLLHHQHSYGIQLSFAFALLFLSMGIGVKQWRTVLWASGLLGLLFTILALLGGPKP